jgi:COP9 signalosome complex subunit 7
VGVAALFIIMSISASTQALARLEPFLLLAKSAKGAAAARLIADVTAAPGCYVFGELFDVDGIRALEQDPQYSTSYRLLELFAYGTYQDYVNAPPESFPSLEPAQIEKLRQLTIVSCAAMKRSLPYDELLEQLGLRSDPTSSSDQAGPSRMSRARSMRQLEDVIIDAIYAGIVTARFDQARSRMDVESVIGRDVRGDEGLTQLSSALDEWQNSTSSMMTTLEQHIEELRSNDQEKAKNRIAIETKMEETLIRLLGRQSKNVQSGGRAVAAYDRMGSDRFGSADVEMEEDPLSLRKKK